MNFNISPFSKGGDLKKELFIPVYKTGYLSSFLHKSRSVLKTSTFEIVSMKAWKWSIIFYYRPWTYRVGKNRNVGKLGT
jgi:hypothetical protein